jgi:hypothetical protein
MARSKAKARPKPDGSELVAALCAPTLSKLTGDEVGGDNFTIDGNTFFS